MNPFKLYYPVYPYKVNQLFGQNYACTEDNNLPLSQRKVVGKSGPDYEHLTCPVGYVELYPLLNMKGHTGEDMRAIHGQPCYYGGPEGIVEEMETDISRGYGVGVITKDKYDWEGGQYLAKIRYWHFLDFAVKIGDTVKTGDLLGHCDNTGFSAGDHLHHETKPVLRNPDGSVYNVFQTNGYYGSVSPTPYWTGEYAKEPEITKFPRNLFLGSNGDDVAILQKILIKNGMMEDFPEKKGYFGSKTRAGVKKLQLLFNLTPAVGYVGPKTRNVLESLSK